MLGLSGGPEDMILLIKQEVIPHVYVPGDMLISPVHAAEMVNLQVIPEIKYISGHELLSIMKSIAVIPVPA